VEPAKRDLQWEARAHIEVQAMIDVGQLDEIGLGRAFVKRLHKEFETVQNLGGLMRHGETGDGPIAQRSCGPC